jgi:hypothetical protein
MTDVQVKNAIGAIWTAAGTALGEPIRVIPRWKLHLRGKEVMSALRSLNNNKIINGVYITRIKRSSRAQMKNHWEYKWTYAIVYFRSYDEGTDANNSEDKLNAVIEKVSELFEGSPNLGLSFVDDHEELQVENIDTIDLRVHAAQCFLTVNITKQP